MKKTLTGLMITILALSSSVQAEYRSWTNDKGVSIDAEFVKTEGDNVTLRLRAGKVVTFPKATLSTADQNFLKTASVAANTETPAAPVVPADRKAKWLNRMDKAQEQSKETGLPILLLFTGTSWCPYCIKLEDEVFSKSDFKSFADQNLVLVKLDFGPGGSPGSKRDGQLAKDYGVKGYPRYFLTDSTGKQLASDGYRNGISPSTFSDWVKSSSKK